MRVWAVLAVLGCGEEPGSWTPERFHWALQEEVCGRDARCGAGLGIEGVLFSASAERCLARHRLDRNSWVYLGYWNTVLARGTMVWHPEVAAACVAWAREHPCDRPLPLWTDPDPWSFEFADADCAAVWEGQVEPGGGCEISEECRDGWCDGRPGCPGRCRSFVPEGGDCTVSRECAAGLICERHERACREPDPRPPLPSEEEPCAAEGPPCRPGLWCDSQGVDTCRARREAGSGCSSDVQCRAGLLCLEGGCRAPTLVGRAGGACDGDSLCDSLAFLTCEAGRCAARGFYGDDCTDAWFLCREGYACSGGICLQLRPDGAPCTSDSQCVNRGCVDGRCGWGYICP